MFALRIFQVVPLERKGRRAFIAAPAVVQGRFSGALAAFFGRWRQRWTVAVVGLGLVAASGALGQGSAAVSVAWEPSLDPAVVGYNVYFGVASLTYTNRQPVGNVTNATISGLLPGTTYYFAATAVDSDGRQGSFSNEASYTVPGYPAMPRQFAASRSKLWLNTTRRARERLLSSMRKPRRGAWQVLPPPRTSPGLQWAMRPGLNRHC